MPSLPLPALVLHADWSMHPQRRWMTCAHRQKDGSYQVLAPVRVPQIPGFLSEIQSQVGNNHCALIGLDFSIGLPYDYARLIKVNNFYDFLLQLDQDAWVDFFNPCETPNQISLYRPFYPMRPGGTRQAHLLDALDLENMDSLRRTCEHATRFRKAASPIFWTMGAQQNGKATIAGWRDLLIPGLKASNIRLKIWPFDGSLFSLFQPGQIITAEAYPAEYYNSLGIKFSSPTPARKTGKRSQADRAANADAFFRTADNLGVCLESELITLIRNGFGSFFTAEDAFDSTVGLFGLIAVLRGKLSARVPLSSEIMAVEGWILGQAV